MIAQSKLAKHPLLSPKAAPVSETLPPATDLEKIAHEIENLPDQAAAVAMINATLGDTAIARFQLGGVLLRMKEQGWFCGCTSFEEVTRDRFGIGKSAAYYAMQIYLRVVDAGLSAETVRQLGIKKLSILCSQAEQGNWTKAGFSTRVEKAKAVTYRKLEESFKAASSTVAPKLEKPSQAAPVAPKPVTPELVPAPKSAMEQLKVSGPVPAVATSEHLGDVLTSGQKQMLELMLSEGLYATLSVVERAFPDITFTVGLPDDAPAQAAAE